MAKQVIVNVTADVPLEARQRLIEEVDAIMRVDDASTPMFRSHAADQPTFIQVLAELAEWTLPLKIAAMAFLAQLAKRAADDAWDSKKEIASALQGMTVRPLRDLAAAINRARIASERKPEIVVGLPIPDPYSGTAIHFQPEDEGEIAWFIAHFIAKADKIEAAVQEEIARGHTPLGRAQLYLQTDGSFDMKWMDQAEMKVHERRIE